MHKYQLGGNILNFLNSTANGGFSLLNGVFNNSNSQAGILGDFTSNLGGNFQSTVDWMNAFSSNPVQQAIGATALGLLGGNQGNQNNTPVLPDQLSIAGGGIGTIINASKNIASINRTMDAAKAARKSTEGLGKLKTNNAMGIAGAVADVASSFIPGLEDQYAGPKGDITQTMDSVYDNVSNTLMAIPGVGAIAGGAMKIGGFVGDILDSAGIGTDKMTTKDAILDSNFLKLTPFGLINALGAKKTQTLIKDNEAFEQVGSSYGGTSQAVDDALKVAGKKYGAFSRKERREANSEISEARRQQMQMAAIADNAADRFAITDSMAAINNNRRALALQGGYNQSAVRVGKQGMQLPIIQRAKQILYNIGQIENSSKLQDGGKVKSRTLQELIEYAKKENPRFIQRMSEPLRYIDLGNEDYATHLMGYKFDPNTQKWYVYSQVQEDDNGDLKLYNFPEAFNRALEKENVLEMTQDEAKLFTESEELPNGTFKGYKAGWPEFFKQKPEKYQLGDSISQKVRDYYKDYNLNGVTVINDNSPRTEGTIIYSPSDEFTVHELWHYLSQNRPNESLKEFYDSLDDSKLKQFGADLDFVKRTGDPSDFYNPSELEARLKAAKFMSQGQNYTKDFFKNLRSNENQYGDNMRDLLRMFNDDYLEKLFNINSAQKFQEGGSINVIPTEIELVSFDTIESFKQEGSTEIELVSLDDVQEYKEGGSINVIPEGALHARLHHMDMDGITKKGIPVVDNNGVQQAEIEHSEIIFRIEVTKKLEELQKKYYSNEYSDKEKNEFALEAGQLLVDEVLHNTDDRIGLIKEVK